MVAKLLDFPAAAAPRRAWVRRRNFALLVALGVMALLGAFLGGQLILSGMSEGYCIVWPSIGTRFAPGYSARGFERVRPGMTKTEVMRLIGPGFRQGIRWRRAPGWDQAEWQPGDESWSYSSDSSALGGDWAWLHREVVFRDGVVARKVRWVFYD